MADYKGIGGYMKFSIPKLLLVSSLFFAHSIPTMAGIVMTGTRVIFPAQNTEKTIQLQNKENQPYLVQVWLDSGDQNSTPENTRSPFLANPQIFKINPNQGQIVRIIFTGDKTQLPQDRESLFFLNFSEIPAIKNQDTDSNKLMVVFKNRLKVLYRPTNLPDSSSNISKHLSASLKQQANRKMIELKNDSAYYANILSVNIKDTNSSQQSFSNKTIAPFSTMQWEVKPSTSSSSQIQIDLVNDYGATVSFNLPLSNP